MKKETDTREGKEGMAATQTPPYTNTNTNTNTNNQLINKHMDMWTRNTRQTQVLFNQNEEKEEENEMKDKAMQSKIRWKMKREYEGLDAYAAAAETPEKRMHKKNREKTSFEKQTEPEALSSALVVHKHERAGGVPSSGAAAASASASASASAGGVTNALAMKKAMANRWPRPTWRAPWRLYRVLSGHVGWVRSIAFEPYNSWFVTGSADRTIKVWDLASGSLRLTLTGHTEQVTGLVVSERHPYLFSCGLDKTVKCWDLEYNKVIRSYHGHLSGVYGIALHPRLDVLVTGGRDSSVRVWDVRTKAQCFCMTGHDGTVSDVLAQAAEPQIISGAADATVKLWDLAAGKCRTTLTYHKKSVRALALHPRQFSLLAASADNVKKYALPDGSFMHNMLSEPGTIVNALGVNEDGLVATGGDNGDLWMWDYDSGHNMQRIKAPLQPGSLESEAAIYALSFDKTGTRLLTCEADKTIKFYKEVEDATETSHPMLPFEPPSTTRRY